VCIPTGLWVRTWIVHNNCINTFKFIFILPYLKQRSKVDEFSFLGWIETECTWYWPTVPAPDGGRWWVWSSQWNYWQWNLNTQRKPVPVPLRPSQIPHDLTWVRTRAALVGSHSQRQTAWAKARPSRVLRYRLLIKDGTKCCHGISDSSRVAMKAQGFVS
jgi:hypothetical protein